MSAQPVWEWGSFVEPVPNPNGLSTLTVVAVDRRGVPCAARPLRTEAPPVPPPWAPPPLPKPPETGPAAAGLPLEPPTARRRPQALPPGDPELPPRQECLEWRLAQGLSQRQLSARCGFAASMVACMESGQREAPLLRQRIGELMAAGGLKG